MASTGQQADEAAAERQQQAQAFVITTSDARLSPSARTFARAHAASWSRRKKKEQKELTHENARRGLSSPTRSRHPHRRVFKPFVRSRSDPTHVQAQGSVEPVEPVDSADDSRKEEQIGSLRELQMRPPRPRIAISEEGVDDFQWDMHDPFSSSLAATLEDNSEGSNWRGAHGQKESSSSDLSSADVSLHPQSNDASQQQLSLSLPPRPATLLDTSLVDPFSTACQPIDHNTSFLLQVYANHIIPNIYANHDAADISNSFLIPYAMEDPVLLNAIAFRSTVEMQSRNSLMSGNSLVLRDGRIPDGPTLDFTYFKTLTIQHLNRRLQEQRNPANASTVCAIVFLLLGEIWLGNKEGIKTQMAGLRALVDMGGGLDIYPASIVAPVMTIIVLASAIVQEDCPIAPPLNDGTLLSETTTVMMEKCPDGTIDKTGQALLGPEAADLLSPRLLQNISDRRWNTVFHELCVTGVLKPTGQDLELFYRKYRTAGYELVLLGSSLLLTPKQEAIRLALLVFEFGNVLKSQKATSAYSQALVAQLKSALEQTNLSSSWAPHCDMLLWILFIGAYSSKDRPERIWFTIQLARGVNLYGVQDAYEFRNLLLAFFYLDRIHRKSLIEVWDEAALVANVLAF